MESGGRAAQAGAPDPDRVEVARVATGEKLSAAGGPLTVPRSGDPGGPARRIRPVRRAGAGAVPITGGRPAPSPLVGRPGAAARAPATSGPVVQGHVVAVRVGEREGAAERAVDRLGDDGDGDGDAEARRLLRSMVVALQADPG